jgi:hypothetical protein
MAASRNNLTKNPKTRKIRQFMDKRKGNVTLCWVPGHAGITKNEEADEEAKRALEESFSKDKKYPPGDLSGWIKTEMGGSRQRRWEEGENVMKERTKNMGWQNDTEKLKRRDQVAVSRLRTVYSTATYRNKIEGTPDPDCPFCRAKLRLEHIQWQCKETEEERRKNNMTKEVWEKGEEGAKMLLEYVTNIGFYQFYQDPNRDEQETTKETANGQGKG